jgi:DNA-binding response OmpR family regulator
MMKILILEPDKVLQNIYEQALTGLGFKVDVSSNAQSAISLADSRTPDLVIIELQLVEHSGIEFLYEFRSYSDWQTIPVIINTIIPANEFSNSQLILKNELNISTYLYKPDSSLKQLIKEVNRFKYQLA